MSVAKIKLNAVSDVQEFVNAAGHCTYDVDISNNHIIIDAKSLLGVLSMDLRKVLTVKYDHSDNHFAKTLAKFAV